MNNLSRELIGFDSPNRSSRAPLYVSSALVLAGMVALTVDVRIAGLLRFGAAPDEIEKVCKLTEVFGHGLGVLLVAVAIYMLDPARRSSIGCLLAAALGSGLVANLLKLTLARTRPNYSDLSGTVTNTFVEMLPFGYGGARAQSFPSGHAATAIGLAVALVWIYPRGAKLFATLACLSAVDRVMKGHHFASDVLWGAAIGYAIASWCVARAHVLGVAETPLRPLEKLSIKVRKPSRPARQIAITNAPAHSRAA